jgi:hypothetical protein
LVGNHVWLFHKWFVDLGMDRQQDKVLVIHHALSAGY